MDVMDTKGHATNVVSEVTKRKEKVMRRMK